jgi:hypothetical protein
MINFGFRISNFGFSNKKIYILLIVSSILAPLIIAINPQASWAVNAEKVVGKMREKIAEVQDFSADIKQSFFLEGPEQAPGDAGHGVHEKAGQVRHRL